MCIETLFRLYYSKLVTHCKRIYGCTTRAEKHRSECILKIGENRVGTKGSD